VIIRSGLALADGTVQGSSSRLLVEFLKTLQVPCGAPTSAPEHVSSHTSSFLNATRHIGRWIGVAHIIGQAMCFWILPESGIPIARSTVQAISDDELRSVSVQHQLTEFDRIITIKLVDINENEDAIEIDQETTIKELSEADNDGHNIPCEPEAQKPEIEDYDEETYSKYTSANVEGTINLLQRV